MVTTMYTYITIAQLAVLDLHTAFAQTEAHPPHSNYTHSTQSMRNFYHLEHLINCTVPYLLQLLGKNGSTRPND